MPEGSHRAVLPTNRDRQQVEHLLGVSVPEEIVLVHFAETIVDTVHSLTPAELLFGQGCLRVRLQPSGHLVCPSSLFYPGDHPVEQRRVKRVYRAAGIFRDYTESPRDTRNHAHQSIMFRSDINAADI